MVVFPLVQPLSSTPSATACAALFQGFVGTMGQSDFHRRTSTDYRYCVPVAALRAITKGSRWISRFSRLMVLCVLGVFDFGESTTGRLLSPRSYCLPFSRTTSALPGRYISKLDVLPAQAPVNASPDPHGLRRMTRGHCGQPTLQRKALSSSPSSRFIPALPGFAQYARS